MKALILVDLQNDFVPGGALPVPEGNAVVEPANRVQLKFERIVATQDWHPPDHGSFAVNHPGRQPGEVIELNSLQQILWPAHCVENTHGAALLDALDKTRIERVFQKGTDPGLDSYSGFYDNGHRRSTGLGEYLQQRGVEEVYVLGLATDYCVEYTALDARRLGFRTFLIEDACRGVELQPGDVERAVEDMRSAGVMVIGSGDLPASGSAKP